MDHPVEDYKFLKLLYELGECLYQSTDTNEVVTSALRLVASYFGVHHGSISLFNPNTNQLEIEACMGLPDDCSAWALPMGVGLTGWVALHNRSACVEDVSRDPRYVKVDDELMSAVAVPLTNQVTTLGVLSIESREKAFFSLEDMARLEQSAATIARVLDQVWTHVHLRRKATQLDSVVKMVSKVSNRFELDGILADVTKEARRILNCEMCSLFLLNEQGALELEVLLSKSGRRAHSETVQVSETSMGTAVTHQKIVEVSSLPATEEHHFIGLKDRDRLAGMLCTPMIYEDKVIGVLNAYTSKPHRFSNSEKQVVGAMADIAAFAIENAKLYRRIIDSDNLLRNSERLTTLGTLASEIAHEIRNPLTVIRLLVESLGLDVPDGDPKERDFKVIMDNIDNLGEIVGRVLNFGKSQSQVFTKWSSNEIVRDCIQLVRFKLQRSRIEVSFEEGEDVVLNCNKGQLQQVFLNLFINAEEAMPDGGSIKIRSNYLEAEEIQEFYFSDSGQGIPEAIQQTVFKSFLTGKASGTGLGLAIVKRIMRDHRGSIEIVKSDPSGTTFRFWLPVHH